VSSPELTEGYTISSLNLRGTGSMDRWVKATQKSKRAASEFTALWDQLKTTGTAEQPTWTGRDLATQP